MKLIIAYINNFKLDDAKNALMEAGAGGLSASAIRGFGQQGGPVEIYRGAEYEAEFTPKFRLEVLVPDEALERTIEALRAACYSGKPGDGKIVVQSVDDVIRISTGERGQGAL